jgi:NitT/TauT family transport system substrate-binding protein
MRLLRVRSFRCFSLCRPLPSTAQALEKKDVHIAVGGKRRSTTSLTIAEQLGYFKDEGLEVKISDFAGGSQALRAVVGGSADVVSGAYEHTINMQAQKQSMVAFVQMGRLPQMAVGIAAGRAASYKSPRDLKGLKVGVSAPGSSTNILFNYFISRDGLKPGDVSIIGVGLGAQAIAAVKSGQIDVLSNVDPMMTKLEQDGAIRIIADWRTVKGTEQTFGGELPAASLYAPTKFVKENPRTVQALTNAIVRADKWLRTHRDGRRQVVPGIRPRRPCALPVRLRQGQGCILEGRNDLRRRGEGDPEGARRLQPEDQPGRDQAVRNIYQRVRQEGEREVQVTVVGAACSRATTGIPANAGIQSGAGFPRAPE